MKYHDYLKFHGGLPHRKYSKIAVNQSIVTNGTMIETILANEFTSSDNACNMWYLINGFCG
jgi:hypothetical protein